MQESPHDSTNMKWCFPPQDLTMYSNQSSENNTPQLHKKTARNPFIPASTRSQMREHYCLHMCKERSVLPVSRSYDTKHNQKPHLGRKMKTQKSQDILWIPLGLLGYAQCKITVRCKDFFCMFSWNVHFFSPCSYCFHISLHFNQSIWKKDLEHQNSEESSTNPGQHPSLVTTFPPTLSGVPLHQKPATPQPWLRDKCFGWRTWCTPCFWLSQEPSENQRLHIMEWASRNTSPWLVWLKKVSCLQVAASMFCILAIMHAAYIKWESSIRFNLRERKK